MELLAVLLALLVLATPVLAISAVVRQRRLRLRIEELAHQTSQQNDALRRELLELRRQVASLSGPTSETPHEHTRQPDVPVAPSKPQTVVIEKPVVVVEKPAVVFEKPAVIEKAAEAPVEPTPVQPIAASAPPSTQKKEITFCPWCGTVHDGGVANCPPAKPATPPKEKTRTEPVLPLPTRVEVPLRTSIPLQSKPPVTQKPDEKTVTATPNIAASSTETKVPAPPNPASPPKPPVVGSSRVDLQACKLEYSIVSPK